MNHNGHDRESQGFFASRPNIVLVGFLVLGGFFLLVEHRAHLRLVIPWLPWLLLLACPLMHLFMHRGHGGHRGDGNTGPSSLDDRQRSADRH